MAITAADLAELVDPARTALVTVEVQEGIVGEHSVVPDLARAADPILPRIGRLVAAARAAGARVVHCTAESRPDGQGANHNARLFAVTARGSAHARGGGVRGATIHAAVGATDADVVLGRLHGVSPMTGASLDPVLRNLGVQTIVATGVSVNVALLGLAFEAVNHGYRVVIPRDAVAGVDAAYVDAVFARTLSLLATVTGSDELVDVWRDGT